GDSRSSHDQTVRTALNARRILGIENLQSLLHERLRYISLGCLAIPAYFTSLVLLHPHQKVAYSLDGRFLVELNCVAFLACGLVAIALWLRPRWSLKGLRYAEVIVFGTM